MDKTSISQIKSCLALLTQYRIVANFSLLLSAAALAVGFGVQTMMSIAAMVLVLGLALGQFRMAIRVGFDSQLLNNLLNDAPVNIEPYLEQLDQSLMALGLLAKKVDSRSLASRLKGCLGLFKWQCGLCILQLIVLCLFGLFFS